MSKKRIAVLIEGDIYNQKGMFNAARNRVKHLNDIGVVHIDVFVFGSYESWLIRKLRKTKKVEKVNNIVLDGITYHLIWKRFSLIDYILSKYLSMPQIYTEYFFRRQHKFFRDYDLIETNSLSTSCLAALCLEKYGVPFACTWHGSDINSIPSRSNVELKKTRSIIEIAACNFFVSKALLKTSDRITTKGRKEVLYNGASKKFAIMSNRDSLRAQFNNGNKIIAFAGNLFAVKNVLVLPDIFKLIYEREQNVKFWIIGDGKLEKPLRQLCEPLPVVFMGQKSPEEMPTLMNCIDILILPSLNEGLPLVTVEALRCGCNVVGSDVGGIAEVIGYDNVFPLTNKEQFVQKIANRCCEMMSTHITQELSPYFNWENTAKKELSIIGEIINV